MPISKNKQMLRFRRRRNLATRRRALVKHMTERREGASIMQLMSIGLSAWEAFDAQKQGLKRRAR